MSELDYDMEFVKREMWYSRRDKMGGMCRVCPKCGGSSTSTCFCAMGRYIDKTSDEDVRKYLEDKKKKRINEINAKLEKNKNSSLELENELKKLKYN